VEVTPEKLRPLIVELQLTLKVTHEQETAAAAAQK
jgi:hypothetical protein